MKGAPIVNVTVGAAGGIPGELIHWRDRLQLQCLILAELINNDSTEWGPFWINLVTISLPMVIL